jgi:hypothetical protein
MDEICEEQTPTGYHSKDMITVDNGADTPATILCGYHELRRHMARHAAERARRVVATASPAWRGGGDLWA